MGVFWAYPEVTSVLEMDSMNDLIAKMDSIWGKGIAGSDLG